MGDNPSIQELHESMDYEFIEELPIGEIKEFVVKQIRKGGWMIRVYMIYQFGMVILGLAFAVLGIIRFFRGENRNLTFILYSLFFSFTLLIPIHELLHGLSLKIVGAPRVTYGANLKKFVFYAEADHFVLNRKKFNLVALAPLVVIKIVSLAGIIIFFSHPAACFFVLLMCLHSLFCAGDIGLLSVFYNDGDREIYTYDDKAEKKSYYFARKK